MSDSSPTDYSMPRSCPPLSTGVCSNSCSLSQWCHLTISSAATLISFCLQSFPASVYSNAFHIRWPKCWSFSFSNSPSNEYLGLISFKIDWFDLAVQGSPKCLLQHHSLKALILGSGRSPGGGHGNSLQYSCLGNLMDRGAWRAMIHRDAETDTTEAT